MAYNVKFLKGTAAQFEALSKDLNTFYYIDDQDLYLGNIKLSNAADLATAIAGVDAQIKSNDTDIENIQKELAALTGNESGSSINQMITDAINALRTELQAEIDADVKVEKERAEAAEQGLAGRISTIEGDYLKGADKTELEGKITAEETRALAAEKVNADAIAAVKEDVDYFFKDALKDEEGVQAYKDTLKEIQDYINSDAEAAGEMTASIKANADAIDAIEADYLKAADKTELTNAINGKVAQNDFDTLAGRVTTVEGAVATKAESSVVEEISGKVTTLEGKVDVAKVSEAIATAKQEAIDTAAGDATSKANTAETNAKTYAKEYADGLAGNYDVKGAAATALTDAKDYTDAEIEKLGNVYDAKGAAATAESNAKSYADGLATNYDAAGSAATAETNAKAYADSLAGNYDAKGSAATAKSEAIEAAATDATGKANTAEANAKAYVDGALTWGTIA